MLTGEAIKLMAEAGADAKTMGHFAVHYPSVLAANLEPLPVRDIDIEKLVRATVQTLFANSRAGRTPTSATTGQSRVTRAQRGAERVKKNIQVNGRRTSVKLNLELYSRLKELDSVDSDKLIQAFANEAPTGHPNRSEFVEQRITNFLVLSQIEPLPTGQH